MTSKVWYLINFIIVVIAIIVCVVLTITKFSVGLYWFAVFYMVLIGTEGLLAWKYLETYIQLKKMENIQ